MNNTTDDEKTTRFLVDQHQSIANYLREAGNALMVAGRALSRAAIVESENQGCPLTSSRILGSRVPLSPIQTFKMPPRSVGERIEKKHDFDQSIASLSSTDKKSD